MQVPAHFEYQRATDVEHAVALLTRHGPECRLVAGGHSLIPMMKLRLAQPEMLVDINELTELAGIEVRDSELRIGALTRHTELLESPLVAEHVPMLVDAERVIADPVVRNRGTVGGSLCQADPSEDLSGAFTALRATAVIRGGSGERTVPVREFFDGPYRTAVGAAEVLVELRVPLPPGTGSAYLKVNRRAGDWAVAAAGAVVRLRAGTIVDAGLGLTAVGAPQFTAPDAERYLHGRAADPAAFAEAGRIAATTCRPVADQRGPVEYKRHLVSELVARALDRATARAAQR
ncbi:FAD binding domain-containing protein [Pseudonocardia endophytica]|uniref:Carbon-monoxide dehydrogenase medium subunit n=1 Tax=Pseudonocardia endophytica TaxID=401976 RepID=A0A4V2PJ61_PSEEN|nr:xanthine dehydrogenase family protein subunit M [Pseudonocardia endophytica]TCK27246.1 carbon-monoxide dehydrogenase medium subunit [Pseudonocardia endophytica]